MLKLLSSSLFVFSLVFSPIAFAEESPVDFPAEQQAAVIQTEDGVVSEDFLNQKNLLVSNLSGKIQALTEMLSCTKHASGPKMLHACFGSVPTDSVEEKQLSTFSEDKQKIILDFSRRIEVFTVARDCTLAAKDMPAIQQCGQTFNEAARQHLNSGK